MHTYLLKPGLALKNPTQKNPPNKTKKKHLKKLSPVWVFLGFISFYSKYVLSTNYVHLNSYSLRSVTQTEYPIITMSLSMAHSLAKNIHNSYRIPRQLDDK